MSEAKIHLKNNLRAGEDKPSPLTGFATFENKIYNFDFLIGEYFNKCL